jgi:hydroxymethylbilane synthase
VSRALAGSCVVPIGAYAEPGAGVVRLRGFVASPDGTRIARGELAVPGAGADPEAAGRRLADQLVAAGAREILAALPQP